MRGKLLHSEARMDHLMQPVRILWGQGVDRAIFFLKLSAHQCAILDQMVLSNVPAGPSTESARATLPQRGDADLCVGFSDHILSHEQFLSTAASEQLESKKESHGSRLNAGQHLSCAAQNENCFRR